MLLRSSWRMVVELLLQRIVLTDQLTQSRPECGRLMIVDDENGGLNDKVAVANLYFQ